MLLKINTFFLKHLYGAYSIHKKKVLKMIIFCFTLALIRDKKNMGFL